MRPKIIGICGKAGSGKDTTAAYFVKQYGCAQMSLATPFKVYAGNVFGFSNDQLWGGSDYREEMVDVDWSYVRDMNIYHGQPFLDHIKAPEYYNELKTVLAKMQVDYPTRISPRIVLQLLGSEFGRQMICEDVWIDHLIDKASILDVDYVVVSDIRFLNELETIHRAGGKIIKLMRNHRAEHVGIVGHRSEAEQDEIPLDTYDFIVNNTGTLDTLYQALDTFYSTLHE